MMNETRMTDINTTHCQVVQYCIVADYIHLHHVPKKDATKLTVVKVRLMVKLNWPAGRGHFIILQKKQTKFCFF